MEALLALGGEYSTDCAEVCFRPKMLPLCLFTFFLCTVSSFCLFQNLLMGSLPALAGEYFQDCAEVAAEEVFWPKSGFWFC